jgi:Phosphotransferase enzyme family
VSAAVSDSELIEGLGGRIDGRVITGVLRRPYRYATSAPLEEVVLEAATERVGPLILKDLSRDRLLAAARGAKPEFLYEPLRELETYRGILGKARVGPRCLVTVADAERGRYWLLLEKVPGVELWQVGEMSVWRDVARWLGAFHERAAASLTASTDPRAEALTEALRRYEEVVDTLASLPRSLLHGELYPSNVIVVRELERIGVFPVDWEMAAIGPGPIDLAALTGGYDEAERRRLTDAYVDGLAAEGGVAPANLEQGIAACRLHLALQWIGWSTDWVPPDEHAHDWVDEALELARDLGLAKRD